MRPREGGSGSGAPRAGAAGVVLLKPRHQVEVALPAKVAVRVRRTVRCHEHTVLAGQAARPAAAHPGPGRARPVATSTLSTRGGVSPYRATNISRPVGREAERGVGLAHAWDLHRIAARQRIQRRNSVGAGAAPPACRRARQDGRSLAAPRRRESRGRRPAAHLLDVEPPLALALGPADHELGAPSDPTRRADTRSAARARARALPPRPLERQRAAAATRGLSRASANRPSGDSAWPSPSPEPDGGGAVGPLHVEAVVRSAALTDVVRSTLRPPSARSDRKDRSAAGSSASSPGPLRAGADLGPHGNPHDGADTRGETSADRARRRGLRPPRARARRGSPRGSAAAGSPGARCAEPHLASVGRPGQAAFRWCSPSARVCTWPCRSTTRGPEWVSRARGFEERDPIAPGREAREADPAWGRGGVGGRGREGTGAGLRRPVTRTTASCWPSGDQSASRTSSATSRGAPPPTDTRAACPEKLRGHPAPGGAAAPSRPSTRPRAASRR